MNIRSVIDNGKNKTARAGLPLAVLLCSLFFPQCIFSGYINLMVAFNSLSRANTDI